MFWVFCNCCFIKPSQGQKRQFFMTSCSHILCSHCTREDANICKKCAAECIIVQCNAQMPDEVKEVFSDTSDNIPNLIKVLDYQEGQRTKLMAHYKCNFYKYKAAKVYINDLEQKLNTIKQKYEACKVALMKQQSNVDMLTKKYQWYKEKCGNIETPSKTPTPSSQLNAFRNKSSVNFTPISGRQSVSSINIPHTPMNSYRTNPQNHFLTPESMNSSRKSSNSSGSLTCSNKVTLNNYTPPFETLGLLSLISKNKHRTREN